MSKSIQLKKGKPITKLISENQQEIKNTTASCELSSFNQKTHSVSTSWARRTICHCELSEAIPYLDCRGIYSEPFGFAQGKLRRRTPHKEISLLSLYYVEKHVASYNGLSSYEQNDTSGTYRGSTKEVLEKRG